MVTQQILVLSFQVRALVGLFFDQLEPLEVGYFQGFVLLTRIRLGVVLQGFAVRFLQRVLSSIT